MLDYVKSCGSLFSILNYAIEHMMDKQSVTLTTAKKDKLLIIDWLIEHFPNAFFKRGNHIKPLKIGIFDDIIDFYERLDSPPFSKKSLREALSYYSASPAYLSCQKEDAPRIDIYGNEVDVVTQDQAKYAYQRYQERYKSKDNSGQKNNQRKAENK